MRNPSWLLALALLVLTPLPTFAGDYYVDAVGGSNSNPGTSWAQAWKTISYSSGHTVAGDVIHIAPGLYDAALGETFPIDMRSKSFIGEGLRLQNAQYGIIIIASDMGTPVSAELVLRRLHITDLGGSGVDGWASSDWDDATLLIRAEHLLIDHCGRAFELQSAEYNNGPEPADALARLDCRDSCLIKNYSGVYGLAWEWAVTRLELTRCTLADHAGKAIESAKWWGLGSAYSIVSSCVVYGNGADIVGYTQVEFSDIEDRLHQGTGNVSADPLFVDPAADDYRLRFGSPCADRGKTQKPPGGWPVDLLGTARPVDGRLDTLERIDMGAFELAPLFLASEPTVGGLLEVELWGPAASPAELWLSRKPLGPGQTTPFGTYYLLPPVLPLGVHLAQSGPPGGFQRSIPNDPQLYGRTFAMQALIQSPAAPSGMAWSNPVEFSFAP